MFDQVLIVPQTQRSVIFSNKHDIHVLPHKFPNELRFKKFGNVMKMSIEL